MTLEMNFFKQRNTADTEEMESINVQKISNFVIEDLFTADKLDACENAHDEMTAYRGSEEQTHYADNYIEYKICLENEDAAKRSLKRKTSDSGAPLLTGQQMHRRLKKTKRNEEEWKKNGHLPRKSTTKKYVTSSKAWKTSSLITNLRMNDGGYTSRVINNRRISEIQSVESAIAMGFVLVESKDVHQPITDSLGRIVAVLAPPPNDLSYHESAKRACEVMSSEMANFHFESKDLTNIKRGDGFFALNVGLSYGMGHTKPTLRDLGRFQKLARTLLGDENIQRLASYQDATYALWHPKAYRYYKTNLDKLWEVYPHLAHSLFSKSIMPSAAFNLGNRVATKKHIDAQNCPFGWCLITALGDFDSTKGGHLVLWDLGIVLEFPAGACICLPSALISHSNIPTNASETRMSFTQYCPGEIFRHIENGFRTDRDLEENDPAILLFRKNLRKTRIEEGYKMFSKIEDLI